VSEAKLSPSSEEFPAQAARESRAGVRRGRPLRIALFGFGTVASSVARILVESKPEGLELTHV
jgi:hypothetical protein